MLTPPRNEINCFYIFDWNFAVGCEHADPSCKNCALQNLVGTYPQFKKLGVTTRTKSGKHVFNGKVHIYPLDDPVWLEPLLPAVAHPTADPDKPPIVIVNVTSDPFHEAIPDAIIRLSFQTIASSPYTGLFLTKRPERATKILSAATPDEQRLWKAKSLIGVSAGDQEWFERRWAAIKPLAESGWSVCASLAPLLGPITPPPDYLSLSVWTIAYGEQTLRKKDARPMDPDWLRAIVKQCHSATPRIPVYIRQMAGRETIPMDLLFHEYPKLPIVRSQFPTPAMRSPSLNLGKVPPLDGHRIINIRGTHGAGKSTIIRGLLDDNDARPLYGALGQRPEAYEIALAGKTTFVLGPYLSPCGGCDAIQPYSLIPELISKYAELGDVLFEGVIISSYWGAIGQLLERWKRNAIIAFLDTSPEECIARVKTRRAERDDDRVFDPANTVQKHATIERLKVKLTAAGVVTVCTITDAADLLLLLNAGPAE